MSSAQPPQGWPFLVARGRISGYSVLLAPDFLIDEQQYGLLETATGEVANESGYRVGTVRTPGGRSIGLVWSEHRVIAADLADSPDSGAPGKDPRDEHSRPLRLIYGFVCADASVIRPAAEDLSRVLEVAIQAYRRFHRDEEHFALEPTSGFPIRSVVAVTDPVSVHPHAAVPGVQTGLQPASRPSESRRRTPSNGALADPSSAALPSRMPGPDAGRRPPWPDRHSDARPVAPDRRPRGSGTQPNAAVTPDSVTPAPTGSRIRGAVVAGVAALVLAASVTTVVKSCEPEPCPPPSSQQSVGESVTGPGLSGAAAVGAFVPTVAGPASFDPGLPSSSVPTSTVPPKGC